MHKRKSLLFIIFVLCLTIVSLTGVACNNNETSSDVPQKNDYAISELEIELEVDSTFQLQVISNVSYTEEVLWESENFSIATVGVDGVVTGKNIGVTRIVAKIDGKTFYTKVTVVDNYDFVPELVLDGEVLTDGNYEITILKNGYYSLSPQLKNVDDVVDFTITSSDTSVQVLDAYKIKGIFVKDNVKLTISCVYQSKSYSILLVVNVVGE